METLQLKLTAPYLALARNQDPFVLVEGPRGTLKTISALDVLMMRAYQFPGLRWYLWRSTRSLLSTTVLPSFENYVIPRWASVAGMRLTNPGARPTHRSEYIFENGSVFTPVGIEDVLRGTSAEGAGGYLAEAVELESSDQATALVGLMRQPGVPFHQIIADVNPGSPGHWANQQAETARDSLRALELDANTIPQDRRLISAWKAVQRHNRTPAANPTRRWKRILTSIVDNPHFFNIREWALTLAGQNYLKGLQLLSGHLFQRWVRGLWIAATGTVFPEFSEERNVVKPFVLPPSWPRWCCIDPGYNHPCGISWNTVAPNGRRYTFDEFKGREVGIDDLADAILRKGHQCDAYYLDPAADQRDQKTNGKSFRDLLAERGIAGLFWPKVSGRELEASVEEHRQAVKTGRYVCFSTCVETIAEHQNWRYKTVKNDVLPVGDDAFEDRNNDCFGADTLVWTTRGKIRVVDLIGQTGHVITPYGLARFGNVHAHGIQELYRWEFSNGAILHATKDHEIQTESGEWLALDCVQCWNRLSYWDEPDHHHQQEAIIRRSQLLLLGGETVLPEDCALQREQERVGFRLTPPIGMGVPPWADPYGAARGSHRRQPGQQRHRESATAHADAACPPPPFSGQKKGVARELAQYSDPSGRILAQVRGREAMAQTPRSEGGENAQGQEAGRDERQNQGQTLRGSQSPLCHSRGARASATNFVIGRRGARPPTLVRSTLIGRRIVYDISVDFLHCLVVNEGLIVSNCLDGIMGWERTKPVFVQPEALELQDAIMAQSYNAKPPAQEAV